MKTKQLILVVLFGLCLGREGFAEKGSSKSTTDTKYDLHSNTTLVYTLRLPTSWGKEGILIIYWDGLSGEGADTAVIGADGHLRLIGKVAYGVAELITTIEADGKVVLSPGGSELIGHLSLNLDLGPKTSSTSSNGSYMHYFNQFIGKNVGFASFDRDMNFILADRWSNRMEPISWKKDQQIPMKVTPDSTIPSVSGVKREGLTIMQVDFEFDYSWNFRNVGMITAKPQMRLR